jgi:uncharacterized membrane protein
MNALPTALHAAGLPWLGGQLLVEVLLTAAAFAIALALRPWRCVGQQGPPWGWCAVWAAVAVLWASVPGSGVLRPMTGVTLLVLMAGWPLAVLAMLPAALLATLGGSLPWYEALQRLVWVGLVPATCVLAVGAAVRRWLPHHLFAYVLGRGFLGTLLASALAGAALLLASPPPWPRSAAPRHPLARSAAGAMPRSIWKGAISFGLVHVPVALYPASSESGIDFDWLDKRSMDPVGYKRINKRTGKEVTKREHIVRGVKVASGDYVVLGEDEIRAAYPKTTQTIEIEHFVAPTQLPVHAAREALLPGTAGQGEKVYALLREAMLAAAVVGVARVVLHTKEHLAVLVPVGPALMLDTSALGPRGAALGRAEAARRRQQGGDS